MVKLLSKNAKNAKNAELLTESDKILADLQTELNTLKNRVEQLEDEKIDAVALHGILKREQAANEFLNEKIVQKEDDHHEDFGILANIMSDLKNPVSQVVENLQDLVEEVPDLELQESVQECVDTATFVLKSFAKTEEYCQSLSERYRPEIRKVHLKTYLQKKLVQTTDKPERFRLFFDRLVPETVMIDERMLKASVDGILENLLENTDESNHITFKVYRGTYAGDGGTGELKMVVNIQSEKPSAIKWKGNWRDSIDVTGETRDEIPLSWLQCRNQLRKGNGDLKILEKEGYLTGTEIHIPYDSEPETPGQD